MNGINSCYIFPSQVSRCTLYLLGGKCYHPIQWVGKLPGMVSPVSHVVLPK